MGVPHQTLLMYGAADLGAPGALVTRSADQTGTFPFATNWDVDQYDPSGWHDVVTNQSRLTVPSGLNISLVRVLSNVLMSTGSNYNETQKGGAAFYGMGTGAFGESDGLKHCVTAPIACTAGDFFSTRTGNLSDEPSDYTWAAIEVLPPATKYALVRNSTTTTHTAGTTIQPSWDTSIVDIGGWYSAGTPKRLTVPSGVTRVKISCSVAWSSAANRVMLWVTKNGANFNGMAFRAVGSGATRTYEQSIITPVIAVTPGDYFEVNAFTTSGRTIQANEKVWFSIEEAPNTKRALVKKSVNQSVPASTWTIIQWDAADEYDTDNFHDPVTNNTRLTVPSGVTYARVAFGASSLGTFANARAIVYKNGVASYKGMIYQSSDPNSGDGVVSAMGPWVPVAAGDYFEMGYFQSTGTTHTFGTQPYNWFAIECL